MKRLVLLTLPVLAALSGCERLGIDDPVKVAAAKEAEAKAIGSACRHAVRAIEDCYVLNPKAQKAAIYAGWREMDEYMRENKLEGVAPVVPRPSTAKPPPPAADADADAQADAQPEAQADAPADKARH
ncbi:MAG: hypothetical protein QM788_00785 [Roseateles sp.]|uniref:hypothetical protein n=1 Tax=Roseateles sp. TaxID=1971397 RepID=UPI0039EB5E67